MDPAQCHVSDVARRASGARLERVEPRYLPEAFDPDTSELEPDMDTSQETEIRRTVSERSSLSNGGVSADSRRVCPSCGRRFNPTSFERHQRVCSKVFGTVRPQFDPMKGSAIFSKANQARVIPPKQDARGGAQSPGHAGTPAGGCRTVTRAATAGSLPVSTGLASSVPAPSTPLTAVRGVSDAAKISPRGRQMLGQRSPSGSATAPVVVVTLTDEASSPAAASTAAVSPAASPPCSRLGGAASAVAAAAVAAAANCRDLLLGTPEKPNGPAAPPGTPGSSAAAPPGTDRPAALQRSDSLEEQEQRVKNMLDKQMQELHEMRRRHSRGREAEPLTAGMPAPSDETPPSPMFDTVSDEVINTFLATNVIGNPILAESAANAGAPGVTAAAGHEHEGGGDSAGGQASMELIEGDSSCGDAAINAGLGSTELAVSADASAEAPAAVPSSLASSATDGDRSEGAADSSTVPTPVLTAAPVQADECESAAIDGATQGPSTPLLSSQAPAPPISGHESVAPRTAVLAAAPITPQASALVTPLTSAPMTPQASAPPTPSLGRSMSDLSEGASAYSNSQPTFVGTGAAAGSRAPKNLPSEAESSTQSGMTGLKVCEDCGRRFNPASFEKHRAVCRSVFGGKSNRAPFESSSQRLRSLPVRQAQTPPRPAAWELDARREAQMPGPPPTRAFSPPKRSSTSEGPTRETSPTGVPMEMSGGDGSGGGNTAAAMPKPTATSNAAPNTASVTRKTFSSKISRTSSANIATTSMPCAIVRTTSMTSEFDDVSPTSAAGGAEGGAASPGPGPARLTSPSRPLQTCPHCNRSFRPAAFDKHIKVCQSVFPNYDARSEQRYVYDSRRHRLKGTPFEAYVRPDRKASVSPCDRAASSTPPQPPRVTQHTAAPHTAHGRGSSRSPKTQLRRSVSEQAIPASSRSNSLPAAPRTDVYPLPFEGSRLEQRVQEDVEKMLADFQEHVDMNVASINLGTPLMEAAADDDLMGTAPADAAAGSAPRAGGDGPQGVSKGGMAGRVLNAKAVQAREGKREAAPDERKNASTSPRQRDQQGPRTAWQDRRGLLERARFGMKMSQRTEYTSLLGGSVSQGSLRDDVVPGKAATRTPSVRTRRRHLAPPPKTGGNAGTGAGTAGPGHDFLHITEHDLVLNVDSLSLSEPMFDAPNQQDMVMPNLASPMQHQGPTLHQGCGDAGSGGLGSDLDRRRNGSSGARRGRSTEDFRSYYERALEHLGMIGTASAPVASANADGIGASASRNTGAEAAATRSNPVMSVPSPMPRQSKRGIAREDLAVTEGKPGLAREDPATAEVKPGLAREDPVEETPSLQRGASGDLLPTRASMMPRNWTTVIPAPPEPMLGASRVSRQHRDDTPQSRTPRGSNPSHTTALHKHQVQSPGQPGPLPFGKVAQSHQLPSPRRRGSENPMLRRQDSSSVRLRPGTASCGNLGSISTAQGSLSGSFIGGTSAAAPRTASSLVVPACNALQHSASAGPASVSVTSTPATPSAAATVLTASKVQGGDSAHAPPGSVPTPLMQAMPNSLSGSLSGSFIAARNGVPRLDFRKVGQPVDRPRTQSSVTASAAGTPVMANPQAGTLQPAGQVVSHGPASATAPVQKQTLPARQSL